MGVKREELEHVAFLARIMLKDEEKEEFLPQLSKILDYFSKLDELEEDVEPLFHVNPVSNVFRDDEVEECLPQEDVLRNAASRQDGYIRGPRIV